MPLLTSCLITVTILAKCSVISERKMGHVDPVEAHSTKDQEVPGLNPTHALHEFLWAQEMKL